MKQKDNLFLEKYDDAIIVILFCVVVIVGIASFFAGVAHGKVEIRRDLIELCAAEEKFLIGQHETVYICKETKL